MSSRSEWPIYFVGDVGMFKLFEIKFADELARMNVRKLSDSCPPRNRSLCPFAGSQCDYSLLPQ